MFLLTGSRTVRQTDFVDPDSTNNGFNQVTQNGNGTTSVADSNCLYVEFTSAPLGRAVVVFSYAMSGTNAGATRTTRVQVEFAPDGVTFSEVFPSDGQVLLTPTNGTLFPIVPFILYGRVGARLRFRGIAEISGSGGVDSVTATVTCNPSVHYIDYETK